MRIVCAPDSFKESMTAITAAAAMARGVTAALPGAEVTQLPLADGGEGTCQTLVAAAGGRPVPVLVQDALGRPVPAEFGLLTDGSVARRGTAVVEVAAACGLAQLRPHERDPLRAGSYGVGELVRAALDAGARRLLIGLGGTATTDAGLGLFSCLGVRFTDAAGQPLPPGGAGLARLARVDTSALDPRLRETRIELLSDVTNPLLGSRGAAAVFAPQKGAGPDDVARLEQALTRWADVVEPAVGRAVRDLPGAGAAGGIGAAWLAFTDASLRPGAEVVLAAVGFEAAVAGADLVLTGEGSLDASSAAGKLPWTVATAAAALGVPTLAFAGHVAATAVESPFLATVAITPPGTDLTTALQAGPQNLERAVAAELRRRFGSG